jgi:diacylglycerol kinase (ATP)
MQNVAFIINPFSAKGNYHPFLKELSKKIKNPLFYISDSIEGTENFMKKHFEPFFLLVLGTDFPERPIFLIV